MCPVLMLVSICSEIDWEKENKFLLSIVNFVICALENGFGAKSALAFQANNRLTIWGKKKKKGKQKGKEEE